MGIINDPHRTRPRLPSLPWRGDIRDVDGEMMECMTTKRDLRRARVSRWNSRFKMFLHGVWWRFLWATRLAKPYSRFMCRRGWYRKFELTGICMYCGRKH